MTFTSSPSGALRSRLRREGRPPGRTAYRVPLASEPSVWCRDADNQPRSRSAYAYDIHRDPQVLTDPATERGPPSAYDQADTHDAVDPGAHSVSVRLATRTPGTAIAYDAPQRPCKSRAARTTRDQVLRTDGDLSSLAWAGVAANGVDDAFRAPSILRNRHGQLSNGTNTIDSADLAHDQEGPPVTHLTARHAPPNSLLLVLDPRTGELPCHVGCCTRLVNILGARGGHVDGARR